MRTLIILLSLFFVCGGAEGARPGSSAAAARYQARIKAQDKKKKKEEDAKLSALKKEKAALEAKIEAARSGTLEEYIAAMGTDGGPAPVPWPGPVRLERKTFGFYSSENAKAWSRWVLNGDFTGAATVEESMRASGALIDLPAGECLTVISTNYSQERSPVPQWSYKDRPVEFYRATERSIALAYRRVICTCKTQAGNTVYVPHLLLSKERAYTATKAQ